MRAPIKKQSLSLLRERGVPVATVLDVGVQRGTPELIACYPDVPHILFEPLAHWREAIAQAYAAVPHTVVTAAVSDNIGETEIFATSIASEVEVSHAWIARPHEMSKGNAVVPMVTLDHYLAEHPVQAPYFLKIDVDGVEMSVLRGARATLAASSIVMIEATVNTLAERISIVEAAGFRLFDLAEPAYYDGALYQVDAIFVSLHVFESRFRPIVPEFDGALYQAFGNE